jgi:DnaJ-class molecular chaperone
LGNPDVRGDHFVTMNVEIPKDLDKDEKDLIQQLKELREKKRKKGFGLF